MKIAKALSDFLAKLGGICLLGMMLLTCADVVGSLFGHPLLGSEELVGMMAFLLLSFALPYTEIEKGHVGVDLLYMRFPKRVKGINDCVVTLITTLLFCLVAWQCFLYAREMGQAGQVSPTLQFPTFYLIYGVSFACLNLALIMFIEFLVFVRGGERDE
ncbi:TRAP-type C4-dicarboxylate transport system, small permease component [uncultured Desulfatiglans sp.]|nr:TRAP-type C4-dicarboxylate transport system, small permease component [uncultured Desulfatiglans sp.]